MENIYHHNYQVIEKKKNSKCYTCKPRGTLKEHIISQTEHFVFNHDILRRPMIIVTSKIHFHDTKEMNETVKLALFKDIENFVDFWNLNGYQLIINNGKFQTHHHFHVKIKIDEPVINRMRRDHFTRINLEKTYKPFNEI